MILIHCNEASFDNCQVKSVSLGGKKPFSFTQLEDKQEKGAVKARTKAKKMTVLTAIVLNAYTCMHNSAPPLQ